LPARSGAVVVFLVPGLFVFFAFMALVVDIGYHYSRKAEIQVQADTGAMLALATVVYAYEQRNSSTAQTNISTATERSLMTGVIQKFGAANGYGSGYFPIANSTFTYNTATDNIDAVALDKSIAADFFFLNLFRLPAFNIGIHSKASRTQATTPPPRNCAFYGKTSVRIHGNSANAIDSYDSRSGDYLTQRIHTDSSGGPYAREMAVGCSDGTFDYNGNIDHHGGNSAVGQTSISGNSFDIFGNVITGGPSQPTGFTSNVHPTVYPAGSGTIAIKATVSPLNLPQVTFKEVCAFPRPAGSLPQQGSGSSCLMASATQNDNGHVTGYVKASELAFPNFNLANDTGPAPSSACDGGSNKKVICLDAGYTYYFMNIDIGNTTDLSVRGSSIYKTIIYLDADSCGRTFKIRGQTNFGNNDNARNVLFYSGSSTMDLSTACSSGGPTLSIAGAGSFAGDLYAPGFDLSIGGGGGPDNGDFYGRIYAKSIDIGGNQSFHYDEAIGTLGNSGTVLTQRVILVE
ncbi:MAG: Tad domain-containing protein, partial [Candidatus Wallbacteria bacterium]|nr:Tad domain-containing protein [Candidatus Wallbacteria bacterium]